MDEEPSPVRPRPRPPRRVLVVGTLAALSVVGLLAVDGYTLVAGRTDVVATDRNEAIFNRINAYEAKLASLAHCPPGDSAAVTGSTASVTGTTIVCRSPSSTATTAAPAG